MGLLAASCGIPTPAAPPSAKEVLAKPQQSNLKDAHFKVTGKIRDNGVTVELLGDGALVYKPKAKGRQWRLLRTEGGFRVLGTPPPDEELERALRAAGAKDGVTVEIGDEEFELA